jgi:hypothetical protein
LAEKGATHGVALVAQVIISYLHCIERPIHVLVLVHGAAAANRGGYGIASVPSGRPCNLAIGRLRLEDMQPVNHFDENFDGRSLGNKRVLEELACARPLRQQRQVVALKWDFHERQILLLDIQNERLVELGLESLLKCRSSKDSFSSVNRFKWGGDGARTRLFQKNKTYTSIEMNVLVRSCELF